jgi:hypothetical protein
MAVRVRGFAGASEAGTECRLQSSCSSDCAAGGSCAVKTQQSWRARMIHNAASGTNIANGSGIEPNS